MLSLSNVFFGVLLLIVAAQGVEYIDDVIARARIDAASYESGKDTGKPVFAAKEMVVDVGALNNETFPSMPDNVKIAISMCYRLLNKTKSFEDTLVAMTQNNVLESDSKRPINAEDIFISGNNDKQIKDMDYFLFKLTNNLKFLAATHISGDSSVNMAKVGMKIFQNLRNSCGSGKKERDIINLAVLQFPQPNSLEISVGHIKVNAWVHCQDKEGGIHGEYVTRKFTPRDVIISEIKEERKKKEITRMDDIFAKIGPREIPPVLPEPTQSSGSSGLCSTAFTSIAAAFTTAFAMMKRNGGDEDEDDVRE